MSPARLCLVVLIASILLGQSVIESSAQELPDTLVICPAEFQPALKKWLSYRTRQGHRIRVVIPSATAIGLKRQVRSAAVEGQLKYVFLIGDSGQEHALKSRMVPTDYIAAQVNVLFGSEPEIATDNTFADLDDDGVPDLAIGRLPADTYEEVQRFANRIIEYENHSAADQQWRRNVNFIAGVGGFGGVVDSVIEKTTKQIITDLVPETYRTSMTFGSWRSPYCPDPRRFSETAIRRFNEGCLFWVYIGHGRPHDLDRVYLPDQSHHILDTETVKQVDCPHGSPIAIFLSCYTGAADQRHDCLAEAMIRQPRGPIGAICGTRVTMPYAMSLLSLELVDEYFQGDTATLGELTMIAKQRMVNNDDQDPNPYRVMIDGMGKLFSPRPQLLKQECLEHVQLIHLFGDPLLRLKRPGRIELAVDEIAESGGVISIEGNAPSSGELTMELCYRRDRFRVRPPHRKHYDSSDESFREYQETYEKAHSLTCVAKKISVAKGPFRQILEVPNNVGGRCVLRCMLNSDEGFAAGAQAVNVRKPSEIRQAMKPADD